MQYLQESHEQRVDDARKTMGLKTRRNYSALSLRRVEGPVTRVFVAMDGDNKRSGMTQWETIASLHIESEDPVLNRYSTFSLSIPLILK